MKKVADIMTMPVAIEVADANARDADIEKIFQYFREVDEQFSTFKETSEVSRLNRGEVSIAECSQELQHILQLCIETQHATDGYFTLRMNGKIDPTGIVKGYAIQEGARQLSAMGYQNYCVEIAGDIQTSGKNPHGEAWRIGIQNPFQPDEIVKVVHLSGKGIATSGNYRRGQHIYDPIHRKPADDIASLTVIGPNVYEADRFVTPAFAMGERAIQFIESLPGFEAYMITKDKNAYLTRGFHSYVENC